MGVYNGIMSRSHETAHHKADLPRLNRIVGQVGGVRKMIEENRHCTDILTQLRAIRAAVKGLEANILERHLAHCVAESLSGNDAKRHIDELKELFRRYDE